MREFFEILNEFPTTAILLASYLLLLVLVILPSPKKETNHKDAKDTKEKNGKAQV